MTQRLLLVSPVRNESGHIDRVVEAVIAQSRQPDVWIVVDDGSEDDTLDALRSFEVRVPFMRVLSVPQGHQRSVTRDRLALAAEARAFNWGLSHVAVQSFTHIAKLDGDIELPPDYFKRVLAEFSRDPVLGICAGVLTERSGSSWKRVKIPEYHVHGALKLYARNCFESIGGLPQRLGWDTIDETYARMKGFATRSLPDVVARHRRPSGSAGGVLRGRARHGECAYVVRYGLLWVTLRSFKMATARPVALSGAAFLYGYLRAAALSAPRVEDDEFRRFVRRELRRRLLHPYRLLIGEA